MYDFCKNYFFSSITIILLLLLVGASYVRFIHLQDYLVSYEGTCDPYSESCFEECDNPECTETYFYTLIERHATELYQFCGPDVSECDTAYECQENAGVCSITYCDPEIDGEDTCVSLTEEL